MKQAHRDAIEGLRHVGYLYSEWEGQFVGGLSRLKPETELSEKQIEQLERMAIKYRKVLARRGYLVPREILEPYYERRRQQKTPDSVKYHWVRERT